MKVYTKTGDDGTTGLFGGERVHKAARRVCAYGAVDEANAAIGLACAALSGAVAQELHGVMSDLFDAGAELATPPGGREEERLGAKLNTRVDASRVAWMEARIDAYEAQLPALQTFILPTGTDAAARLHVARTVVRRAEREVARLAEEEPVRAELLVYLNRTSDYLFVLSRFVNSEAGVADVAWLAKK